MRPCGMHSEVPCNKQPAALHMPSATSQGEAGGQLLSGAVQVCGPFPAMTLGSFWRELLRRSRQRGTRMHAGESLCKV